MAIQTILRSAGLKSQYPCLLLLYKMQAVFLRQGVILPSCYPPARVGLSVSSGAGKTSHTAGIQLKHSVEAKCTKLKRPVRIP